MKPDWKAKLTSRKFWAAIAGFVTAVLALFAIPELTIEKVITVIGACGTMIAYIVGEGLVDAAKSKETKPTDDDSETK